MHFLNLQITDSADCSSMIVRDASIWDPLLPIQNAILEVQTPLSDCSFSFQVTNACAGVQNFGIILGCSQLEICCQDCIPTETQIPDGNYNIKFSVDPNIKTMVEFNYFRTCELYNKYIGAVCATRSLKPDYRPDEYEHKLYQLQQIRNLIDSAKWSAEECLNVKQGLIIYNEALDSLQKYTHKTCL